MRIRRRNITLFGTSFLDVLCCALGGVLLLLMLLMNHSQRRGEQYRAQIDSMEQQMVQAQRAIADAMEKLKTEQEARVSLEKAQSALIGFRGDFNGVVFIFDTSGSMESGGRFSEYQSLLKQWVSYLPFSKFNVVEFGDAADEWRAGKLVQGAAGEREAACRFVDGFSPGGGTNTLEALKVAFAVPDVDTIVLMSDGVPNQSPAEIHAFLEQANRTRSVAINCVALGDYFAHSDSDAKQTTHGPFLQEIARTHGGMFIGR